MGEILQQPKGIMQNQQIEGEAPRSRIGSRNPIFFSAAGSHKNGSLWPEQSHPWDVDEHIIR